MECGTFVRFENNKALVSFQAKEIPTGQAVDLIGGANITNNRMRKLVHDFALFCQMPIETFVISILRDK